MMQHIFDVYRVEPGTGDHKYHLVGRFMNNGHELDVLADFHGYLGALDNGPLTPETEAHLRSLTNSPYFRVVDRESVRQGHHLDLMPEAQLGDIPDPNLKTRPPAVFMYEHPVIGKPMKLESKDGELYFQDKVLSRLEAQRIMENIRSGVATIRYNRSPTAQAIMKKAREFASLLKVEPKVAGALDQLRAAVKAGHVHPDVLKHLTSEIFTDPMVHGVGNKKAFADFLSRPKQGVHIRMDGNDFGQINKIHSFEHGNQAITAMGGAMRAAMDKSVGRGNGKLFRIGGDEFHAFVPSHDHAAQFMRELHNHLEKIPPVGGTHKLSVSAGFGLTPEHADQASIQAKGAKKAANYQPGQARSHTYSAVPGFEGHIPMSPEQLPLVPPPAGIEKPTGGPADPPKAPAAPGAAPAVAVPHA